MDRCGKLLRIERFRIANAELALVGLRKRCSGFKDDYVIGHSSQSLARALRACVPARMLGGLMTYHLGFGSAGAMVTP